jgi:hypothetical protein
MELSKLREKIAKTDTYLSKLYRWNANLNKKIIRVQRERIKLVQQLEKEEVRCGLRDPCGTTGA